MFMKKSQIVISKLNFHRVSLFRANRAFPIIRLHVTDDLCFENDLHRLKEYVLTKHVIEEAV